MAGDNSRDAKVRQRAQAAQREGGRRYLDVPPKHPSIFDKLGWVIAKSPPNGLETATGRLVGV